MISQPGYSVCKAPKEVSYQRISICANSFSCSDYFKIYVLTMGLAGKFHLWRLDFNKNGQLARNFAPDGAAAVVRDANGQLRFLVWDDYQLHGDIVEGLGLSKNRSLTTSRHC